MDGANLRGAARRRHPAGRLHDPVHGWQALIEQGQLADITDRGGRAARTATKFNPNVLAAGQDANGKIFALPTAGLRHRSPVQPDPVQRGWSRSRTSRPRRGMRSGRRPRPSPRRPGRPATSQMTQSNTGGWMLTTLTYAQRRPDAGRRRRRHRQVDRSTTRARKAALESAQDAPLGATTRWAATSCSTGARSTRSSRPERSACICGGSDVYTSLKQQNEHQAGRLRPGDPAAVRRARPPACSAVATLVRGQPQGHGRRACRRGQLDRLLLHAEAARPGGRSERREDPRRRQASQSACPRCRSSTRRRSTSPLEWIEGLRQRASRPDGVVHARASSTSRSCLSRRRTPRRCTRSSTPSCRQC